MKAIFERKPSDFDLRSFEVSKTIQLPAEVFEAVLQKPMRDYVFIQENIEQMTATAAVCITACCSPARAEMTDCWWNRRATATAGMPPMFSTFPL